MCPNCRRLASQQFQQFRSFDRHRHFAGPKEIRQGAADAPRERARDRREKYCPRTFRLRPERRPQRVHRPALQRPRRNDRRAALGNHHGSRAPHPPASKARRHSRVRNHLHHPNGRRRRSPQKIHRRQRAGCEEFGYLRVAPASRRQPRDHHQRSEGSARVGRTLLSAAVDFACDCVGTGALARPSRAKLGRTSLFGAMLRERGILPIERLRTPPRGTPFQTALLQRALFHVGLCAAQ